MNGIAESKGRWIDVDKRDMQVCSGNFMLQVQRSRYGNPVSDGIPDDISVKTVFEVGSPGPAVLSVAKKFDADLIIMGSRGLGPLKGLFMGSVSSYVVTHSTCPVLIVK